MKAKINTLRNNALQIVLVPSTIAVVYALCTQVQLVIDLF
jgi:hypothetical protein